MIREYYLILSPWLEAFFLTFFAGINVVYVTLLALGAIQFYQRRQETEKEDFTSILRSNSLPTISFLVPAYNESPHIVEMIDNLLNLTYRYKQIIVVNDGSTDDTFDLLSQKYDLMRIPDHFKVLLPSKPIKGVYRSKAFPELLIVDKVNGRKYDALNAALSICKTPYFITVDADTFVDNAGFEALVRPMLMDPDNVAIGADVGIRNNCTLNFNRISTENFPQNYVTAMQALEYTRAFHMRQGWNYLGGSFVLSGAFSILITETVIASGGYADTVADDLEIILRLNRMLHNADIPYKITYMPDPVAWTEAPNTIRELGPQRLGWQRGTLEAIWFHKSVFMNPRYGKFGLFVFPFLVVSEAVEPLVEIAGYVYIITGLSLRLIDPFQLFLVLAIITVFYLIYTLNCLFIEQMFFNKYPTKKSLFWLVLYSFFENFGYRQCNLYWRLKAQIDFFKKFSRIKKVSSYINSLKGMQSGQS